MEETRKEKVKRLFTSGYNCSQAVFAAYSDLYGMEEETALKLSASFGGGMGRMREVCGAVSGMFMVAGLATGSADCSDKEAKKHNYDVVQKMAAEFKKVSGGSIICRELMGIDKNADTSDTTPDARTPEYYQKRPCVQLVQDAADVIEKVLFQKECAGTGDE